MELERRDLEFDDEEINVLIRQLDRLYKNQQADFSTLCYTIYKIDCWFEDNSDVVLKSKYDAQYYNRKQLFNALGIKNKQRTRFCACYEKFMTLDDVGSKLKEPFVSFTPSKLFELLPYSTSKLIEFIENGQLSPNMTVKEIREFFKSLEEKENVDDETSSEDVLSEDNYIVLKNDTARHDFLNSYKTWGLWFEESRLGLKYYRCKIGERLLVAVCSKSGYCYSGGHTDVVAYHYLNEDGSMLLYPSSEHDLISDMKSIEGKKVYLFN